MPENRLIKKHKVFARHNMPRKFPLSSTALIILFCKVFNVGWFGAIIAVIWIVLLWMSAIYHIGADEEYELFKND